MENGKVKRLFNIYGYTGGNFGGNVYDTSGLSPTIINFAAGGNRQPMVMMPKLVGGVGIKKSNNGTQYYQQDRVYSAEEIAMAHPAQIPGGSYKYLVDAKIRKLTPCECWKLMGFTQEDFLKAKEVNSDTQLYKQAGNSIVVQVLEAIFKQML